ncbi:hypothetical protein HSB1_20030 [Halogranum salarium B-1]|uniref:Uncharacterized protein n=1 Tax=Halogranum salarium B-1 TaxID=1210908 RepID=J2ZGM7_9EURY|nr:hypothetical protein HSB1_20030 [Halogranum salarium B-1]
MGLSRRRTRVTSSHAAESVESQGGATWSRRDCAQLTPLINGLIE